MPAGVRFRLEIENHAGQTHARQLAMDFDRPRTLADLKTFLRAVRRDLTDFWRGINLGQGQAANFRSLFDA